LAALVEAYQVNAGDSLQNDQCKVISGLASAAFGAVKGSLKMGPSAYVSPEDVKKGSKKSVAEVLLPAEANVPSGVARGVVRTISDDPRWVVLATVALKLSLRSGATALAKAASAPGAGASGGVFQKSPRPILAAIGRNALNCTIPDNFIDCARPSEDFVLKPALRPLFSR
jgi:hypothetical protein